jgi:hypothetical protein
VPTTSSGETVYASPGELVAYIQTDPASLGLSDAQDPDGDGVSEWREFFQRIQTKAKGRIDDYCRRDFEDHSDDTVTLDGGSGSKVLTLPSPVREVQAVRVEGDVEDTDNYHAKESGPLVYTADAPQRGVYGNPGGAVTARQYRGGASGHWPAGYGNIEVDLAHGYQTPPRAIQEAEMKLVDHTVVGMAQKREGMVVQADSFEMQVNIPVAMNSEIRSMLKPHREVGVGN